MGKTFKNIKVKFDGGTLLAGAGRGGVHKDKKHPSAKALRQEWKNKLNREAYS